MECTLCGEAYPKDFLGFRCRCGGPLDIRFETVMIRDDLTLSQTLWRYRRALPLERDTSIISLGEGMTPVLEETVDGSSVGLKLEYLAPTGSFKDRGASVLLSRLKEMGVEEILEDSSGNAGCSLAAYSAAAGIRCRVMVPANIPEGKAVQIASYGAILERVSGTRDDVANRALERSRETFYASHNWQPFFLQGTKTFAYEVFEQMDPLPDYIFYPIGNGSLLVGSHKGFKEMKAMRWLEKVPGLVGVQAVSHSPIYTAITGKTVETKTKKTLAGGIAIGQPARLRSVVEAIRATDGTAVVVNDAQIQAAQRWLARRGYLVEPTSAAALAGYNLWREANRDFDGRVLIPLTGLGLKDLDSLSRLADSA